MSLEEMAFMSCDSGWGCCWGLLFIICINNWKVFLFYCSCCDCTWNVLLYFCLVEIGCSCSLEAVLKLWGISIDCTPGFYSFFVDVEKCFVRWSWSEPIFLVVIGFFLMYSKMASDLLNTTLLGDTLFISPRTLFRYSDSSSIVVCDFESLFPPRGFLRV